HNGVEGRQSSLRLIATVVLQKPGSEFNDIGSLKIGKLLRPGIRLHQIGTVAVTLLRVQRNRIAPISAFLRTNVQPLIDGLCNRPDFGAAGTCTAAGMRILTESPRLLQSIERLVGMSGRRFRRIPNLIACLAVLPRSLSDVSHASIKHP